MFVKKLDITVAFAPSDSVTIKIVKKIDTDAQKIDLNVTLDHIMFQPQ